jgi:hypothetical protein
LFAEEGTFDRKAERFTRILQAIETERPTLAASINEVLELIKQARGLGKKRNRYVHALVINDFQTNTIQLRSRREGFQCDESEIIFLVQSAEKLAFDTANACAGLSVWLDDLRKVN